jgi:replication factor C subunit 3/5
VVVFNEADSLSRNAQAALRRTMEKYMDNMRILLCCESLSKIIGPIRSRCFMVRIPAPTDLEIVDVLLKCSKAESLNLPVKLAQQIAQGSGGNVRKSLLILEAMRMQQHPFVENQPIPIPDWELLIKDLADMMVKEQSSKWLHSN